MSAAGRRQSFSRSPDAAVVPPIGAPLAAPPAPPLCRYPLGGVAHTAQPTIPIIVKDTTSFYWQVVLAGARKAGGDLGVDVPELGAQSESDIDGQIDILEKAVASSPASKSAMR